MKQCDQGRADERKDLGSDCVRMIAVSCEKRLDKEDALAADRGQRKLERSGGVRDRVSCGDQLDAGVACEEGVSRQAPTERDEGNDQRDPRDPRRPDENRLSMRITHGFRDLGHVNLRYA
jgi:hypothetical protein